MLNNILLHSFRFLVLVALQVIVLNNIQFSGFINPYLYVLFILLLPFEIPGWLLLVLSFVMGITIDMFGNTQGLHASATVFLGFLRPYMLNLIAPRDGYEFGTKPSISQMGFNWFITYASILVFIHHFTFFFLEAFKFSEFFRTLFKVIASSAFTLMLIILTQYLFSVKKRT